MNVKGKVLEVFETQQVSNSFKKREFVLEYAENPQYPEVIKFELIQDKCALLDNVKAGDQLDVSFNLKGRKWTDPKGEVKYFNSLQAWKLDAAGSSSAPAPAAAEGAAPMPMEEPGWVSDNKEEDDLPF